MAKYLTIKQALQRFPGMTETALQAEMARGSIKLKRLQKINQDIDHKYEKPKD
jgi:hypothetical protein